MLRAMHWYESFICVQKLSEFPCSNRIAPPCTQVRYGAITALNRCENYVLHTTMFFRKITFLPRDCSASFNRFVYGSFAPLMMPFDRPLGAHKRQNDR